MEIGDVQQLEVEEQRANVIVVLRLEGGRARQVDVSVVARNGTTAWLREGLKAGDTVIVYPPASDHGGVRAWARTV